MGNNSRKITAPKIIFLLALAFFFTISKPYAFQNLPYPEITFTQDDRILVMAPHPDDEVLGCAGVMQKAKEMGLPIKVAFFTCGDSNEWSFMVYRKYPVLHKESVKKMGYIRQAEAIQACRTLGVKKENIIFMGYPDNGTLDIWCNHWLDRPAIKSLFTRVREVPYKNALTPGAPYKGEAILSDLKKIILDFKPTKIFISHPCDYNPDHKALYLFTRVALWELEDKIDGPEIYPYLVHFKRWPYPKGYKPKKDLYPPIILREAGPWFIDTLKLKEIFRKKFALQRHKSQYDAARKYLESFVRCNELFGDLPFVTMRNNQKALVFANEVNLLEAPEYLTDSEKESFVGVGQEGLMEDGKIVLKIKLSKAITKMFELSLYLFGYRDDVPFGHMPKLRINIGPKAYKVYDQSKEIDSKEIIVERKDREIILKIPLASMGHPEYIFTSARAYLGVFPVHWASWIILEIEKNTGPANSLEQI